MPLLILFLFPHTNKFQLPLPIASPISSSNNAKDMAFLVQIKQSKKCGSVKNDEIEDRLKEQEEDILIKNIGSTPSFKHYWQY